MANTITRQTILDGSRKTIIKIHIVSDNSGEETNYVLVDSSDLLPADHILAIESIDACLRGFSVDLIWKADTNVDIITIPAENQFCKNYRDTGRLTNNAGPGRNGDILMTTTSLATGDEGTIILSLVKKGLYTESN